MTPWDHAKSIANSLSEDYKEKHENKEYEENLMEEKTKKTKDTKYRQEPKNDKDDKNRLIGRRNFLDEPKEKNKDCNMPQCEYLPMKKRK